MGIGSSKNTCQNENNQIQELKSKLQQSNDRLFQYQLKKSNYNPENDNNILVARVGGGRKKKSLKRKRRIGTKKRK